MHVAVHVQGFPGYRWEYQVAALTSVDAVKSRFCRDLSLAVDTCQLALVDQQTAEASSGPEHMVRLLCIDQ